MDWSKKKSGSLSTLNSLSLASLLKLLNTMNASSSQVCSFFLFLTQTYVFLSLEALICMTFLLGTWSLQSIFFFFLVKEKVISCFGVVFRWIRRLSPCSFCLGNGSWLLFVLTVCAEKFSWSHWAGRCKSHHVGTLSSSRGSPCSPGQQQWEPDEHDPPESPFIS